MISPRLFSRHSCIRLCIHRLNRNVKRLYSNVTSEVSIRQMKPDEATTVLPRAAQEGSSPTPYECQTITHCNPDGVFVAETKAAGIIGSISALKYSETLGHVGFYHVDPEYRGKGIGKELWNKAVQYLGENCNIGIDVPTSRTELLTKLGFQRAWTSCRYKGIGVALLPEVIDTHHVRPLARLPLAPLVEFDSQVFTAERRKLVQRWSNTPKPGGSYAAVKEGSILGYAVIQPSIEGHVIGPLYAANTALTQALLLTLFAQVPEQTIYVDAPVDNPSFIQLLSVDLRMEAMFESVRMYSKGDPGVVLDKMFALSSLEMG
ncbi:holothin acyltransferase-like [Glandiceps talaboti]